MSNKEGGRDRGKQTFRLGRWIEGKGERARGGEGRDGEREVKGKSKGLRGLREGNGGRKKIVSQGVRRKRRMGKMDFNCTGLNVRYL